MALKQVAASVQGTAVSNRRTPDIAFTWMVPRLILVPLVSIVEKENRTLLTPFDFHEMKLNTKSSPSHSSVKIATILDT